MNQRVINSFVFLVLLMLICVGILGRATGELNHKDSLPPNEQVKQFQIILAFSVIFVILIFITYSGIKNYV